MTINILLSMEPWAAAKKRFKLVAVPPAPVRSLANTHLPRESCQSRLSANYKGDNEMISGTVLRSPGICLTAEENPEKSPLGDLRRRLCDQYSPHMGSHSFK